MKKEKIPIDQLQALMDEVAKIELKHNTPWPNIEITKSRVEVGTVSPHIKKYCEAIRQTEINIRKLVTQRNSPAYGDEYEKDKIRATISTLKNKIFNLGRLRSLNIQMEFPDKLMEKDINLIGVGKRGKAFWQITPVTVPICTEAESLLREVSIKEESTED